MMRRWGALLLIVALAACSTGPTKANLQEASRINTQLGIDYARKGNFDVAMDKLKRALEQDSNNATAHSASAFVYQQLGEYPQAERHYRRALSLEGNDSSVRNNFGVFLCARGKIDEALQYLTDAAQDHRYPTPEAAWTNAGICVKSRDPERAEQYFREALRVNPAFPDALGQMAWISFQKQNHLAARAFVQRYEQTGRSSPEVLWVAAQTEAALGDPLAAHKYQTRLRREFPDSPEASFLSKSNIP